MEPPRQKVCNGNMLPRNNEHADAVWCSYQYRRHRPLFPLRCRFDPFQPKRCSFCDVYHRYPLKLSGGYGNSLPQCLISGHLRWMLNFTSLSNYSWPILVVFNELGLVWWLISDQKVRNSVFWIRYICSIVLDGIEILLLIVSWTESVEGSGDDEQRVWGIWTPVLRAFC